MLEGDEVQIMEDLDMELRPVRIVHSHIHTVEFRTKLRTRRHGK